MKKLMVVAGVMALLVCGAVVVACAQGPGGGPHKGWGGPGHGPGLGMAMLHELNLTDAQKEQVKSIMKENHASMQTVMQQMAQNRALLLAATANGAFDVQKIQGLANQQALLEATMIVNRATIEHQIYTQVLFSDQQAKAEQLRTNQINRINEHLKNLANGTDTPPPPAN